MSRRIDYVHDPDAPPANSLVPGVNVLVVDDSGRILTIQRTDNDWWSIPGGAMELGESVVMCGVRETEEETGILCEITGLVGVYSDPGHVIHYTSNDEVRQEFGLLLVGRPVGGSPRLSTESSRVEWLDPLVLQARLIPADPMRRWIDHYLAGPSSWPYLG